MTRARGVTTYTDYLERPTELSAEELSWFYGVVEKAKRATGCTVDIVPFDHDLYAGKSKDALGCCVTTDPKNQLGDGVETYITVDCYFIDECFRSRFFGDILISGDTLEGVLAHEIAHLYVWRHGKRHSALTESLLGKILAA